MRKVKFRTTELFKNKVVALILMVLAVLTVKVNNGDATAFMLLAPLAISLFFAKENCIS